MGIIVVGCLGLGALLVTASLQRRYRRMRNAAQGLAITYFTIGLIILAGEFYFRFIYAEPDGLPTLALQNWKERYWRVNESGYRDREWSPDDWLGKKTIIISGDSFAAGWGIENPEDRFGDVLSALLGEQFAVLNLGEPGASTVEATENLREHPLANPDLVILQYYLNDIEHAALSIGLDPHLDPTRATPAWANESYLANFVYWRLLGQIQPEARGTQTYWSWLYSMYDHSAVWAIHQEQINAFIDLVESKNARLIAVIFPNMLDPFNSIPYVDRVAQVFANRGYDKKHILKLFDAAESMPPGERIVSERDAHASVTFHRLVGDMLYAVTQELFSSM